MAGTASSWWAYQQAVYRQFHDRLSARPDISDSSRLSLVAVVGVLLAHCSEQNRLDDGRLCCWPSVRGDDPERGLVGWLGCSDRRVRELVRQLAALGVIDVLVGPTTPKSRSGADVAPWASGRHSGTVTIGGKAKQIGRVNLFVINPPAELAGVTVTPDAARVVRMPQRGRSPTVARETYRVPGLPAIPRPLLAEWTGEMSPEELEQFFAWLRERWSGRRADMPTDTKHPIFEFYKQERWTFRKGEHERRRGAGVRADDAESQRLLAEMRENERRARAEGA